MSMYIYNLKYTYLISQIGILFNMNLIKLNVVLVRCKVGCPQTCKCTYWCVVTIPTPSYFKSILFYICAQGDKDVHQMTYKAGPMKGRG